MKQFKDVILSLFRSKKFFIFFMVFALCFTVSTIALFLGKMNGSEWNSTMILISGLVLSYGVLNVGQKKLVQAKISNTILQEIKDAKDDGK